MRVTIFVVVALLSSCASEYSGPYGNERIEIDRQRLQSVLAEEKENVFAATRWVIINGITLYSATSIDEMQSTVAAEFNTHLWQDPIVNSEPPILAEFRIGDGSISSHVIGVDVPESSYEFWIVKLIVPDSADFPPSVTFFVTLRNDETDERAIVDESDQFLPEYVDNNRNRALFPSESLVVQHRLQAWFYPQHYEATDFDDFEVRVNSRGEYRSRKWK